MVFCSECFVDPEIRARIKEINTIGNCPICGGKGVFLYDSNKNKSLDGVFDNLIDVYSTRTDLPDEASDQDLKMLANIFQEDWEIFSSISVTDISDILKTVSYEMYSYLPELFTQPVGIAEKYNQSYLQNHSILKNNSWNDFLEGIKYKNRFHTQIINLDLLSNYCRLIAEDLPVSNKRYYRGRISNNSKGFSTAFMGAPPCEKATAGRANSDGISRLYLTNDRNTTLHEIRAAEYDYITIGTFKQLSPLRIVNLSRISRISPLSEDVDCTELAINKDCLAMINKEMAKTLRRGDSLLDYLPTQYICDFVMSIADEDGRSLFDGIMYQSAMNNKSYNLAIFDPSTFKCTYCRTYEIVSLKYKKRPC